MDKVCSKAELDLYKLNDLHQRILQTVELNMDCTTQWLAVLFDVQVKSVLHEYLLVKVLRAIFVKFKQTDYEIASNKILAYFQANVESTIKLSVLIQLSKSDEASEFFLTNNFADVLNASMNSTDVSLSVNIVPVLILIKRLMKKHSIKSEQQLEQIRAFLHVDLIKNMNSTDSKKKYCLLKYMRCMQIFNQIKSNRDDKIDLEEFIRVLFDQTKWLFALNLNTNEQTTTDINAYLDRELTANFCIFLLDLINFYYPLATDKLHIVSCLAIIERMVNNFDFIYKLQDDTMIKFNLACLRLYKSLGTHLDYMNPNLCFLKLLLIIKFNVQLVVDWLISNETCFLEYFVYYLKYLNKNKCQMPTQVLLSSLVFSQDLAIDQNDSDFYIRRVYAFLTELCTKVTLFKKLFPYNCNPLLNLLNLVTENA